MTLSSLSSTQQQTPKVTNFHGSSVRTLIAGYLGIEVKQVIDEAHLCEDLGLDWLERLELMLLIEDEFADLEIPEGVAHRVENVGDVLRYVELAIMERRGPDSLQNGELALGRSAA
jgi:acyl carrier protein